MILKDFKHFGGRHVESANLANALAYSGVRAPHTGEPLTEAMSLGIAGGISAGYQFCPSVPRYGYAGGVTVVGRCLLYATDASFYDGALRRLGIKPAVRETTGAKAAYKNLSDVLASGRPAIVWCGRSALPYYGTPVLWGSCAMQSILVYGVDESKGLAHVSEWSTKPLTIALEDLARTRGSICSHKNRVLSFEPPRSLTKDALVTACLDGVRTCARQLLQPRIGSFSLPGLDEWGKVIANGKNSRGWLKVFPGGKIILPLLEAYDSIETSGGGGRLFRPMYADFLEETARVSGRTALADCAATYRELGEQWGALADAALPKSVQPFQQARKLLEQRYRAFIDKGPKGLADMNKSAAALHALIASCAKDPPLDATATVAHLEGLVPRIVTLAEGERRAAEQLAKAAA
jgi:hypothetical protein